MTAERQLTPESLVARIIAELDANPHAQRLLLRAMLTNEFLGVPARLDRIEKDVAELKIDVAALKTDVEQLKTDVDVLKTDVDVLKTDVAVLKTDVAVLKTDVAVLKTDVAVLKTDVAVLKTDVGALKGSDLEMKVHRRIRPLLSQSLQVRRTRIIQSAVHQAPDDFSEAIAAAADEKRISWDQEQRIVATDIIVRAQRQSDRAPVWIAVEVANRLDVDDLTRSRTSADTLAAVFGEEGVAVVVGHRIDAVDRERAAAAGVRYLEVPERF